MLVFVSKLCLSFFFLFMEFLCEQMCVSESMCLFLVPFLWPFIFPVCFVLSCCCLFSNESEREWIQVGGEVRKIWNEFGERETIIRIFCMKKKTRKQKEWDLRLSLSALTQPVGWCYPHSVGSPDSVHTPSSQSSPEPLSKTHLEIRLTKFISISQSSQVVTGAVRIKAWTLALKRANLGHLTSADQPQRQRDQDNAQIYSIWPQWEKGTKKPSSHSSLPSPFLEF